MSSFTTESVENKSRKITNVSFLDEELQNQEEERKAVNPKRKAKENRY